ncbi:MAG: hypothetical protein P9L92_19935 [Candidatus Electryonea clarkiae]|nr:hypothetical protein [Candidatus Electryonea clarkiae]MDP8285404.1 hypothetical protein [Candidatus Electryonea clarkiae]
MKKKLITGIVLLVLPFTLLVGNIQGTNKASANDDKFSGENKVAMEAKVYGEVDPMPATPVE